MRVDSAVNYFVPPVVLSTHDVFGQDSSESEAYFAPVDWTSPVTFFVGRNGSGKSKTARAICDMIGDDVRLLSTDRLIGLMNIINYTWGTHPTDYRGIPLDDESRPRITSESKRSGLATEALYSLREEPEVWLRVAAFVRCALHRSIELRESSGFLDPYVRLGSTEYSLLRDEGHGLREFIVLLAATYRTDWRLLIVDEPELHLHPSLARLWLAELRAECVSSNRRAIVITHEPSLVRPSTLDELRGVWLFQPALPPKCLRSCVDDRHLAPVAASLRRNPDLVSQLVFSPRPVLLEGSLDVAAMATAIDRIERNEVVAQTDLIDCGGSGGVAAWFTIARAAGVDVRAVGDLDCCLDSAVQQTLDNMPQVVECYRIDFAIEPPSTSEIVKPLIRAADKAGVPKNNKSRAAWMAQNLTGGDDNRLNKLLAILREANLWLHRQGTLEAVLGLSETEKNREAVISAASKSCAIDDVVEWFAFQLDPSGEVFALLELSIETMAHRLLEALKLTPEGRFSKPVGVTSISDARLADVTYVEETGKHRFTVRLPREYAGYWLEVDRTTPPSQITLCRPKPSEDQSLTDDMRRRAPKPG